jgi:hypothetical protein
MRCWQRQTGLPRIAIWVFAPKIGYCSKSEHVVLGRRCGGFRARRDVGFRLGMPTRASATQAGGSLAGKGSITLSRISSSSVLAIVSLSCKGRALARPFRLRRCDALDVIDLKRPFRPGSGCSAYAVATAA